MSQKGAAEITENTCQKRKQPTCTPSTTPASSSHSGSIQSQILDILRAAGTHTSNHPVVLTRNEPRPPGRQVRAGNSLATANHRCRRALKQSKSHFKQGDPLTWLHLVRHHPDRATFAYYSRWRRHPRPRSAHCHRPHHGDHQDDVSTPNRTTSLRILRLDGRYEHRWVSRSHCIDESMNG
jgi:hypothetical protein